MLHLDDGEGMFFLPLIFTPIGNGSAWISRSFWTWPMEMPGMCSSAALARSVHSVVTVLFWRGFRDDVSMVMIIDCWL